MRNQSQINDMAFALDYGIACAPAGTDMGAAVKRMSAEDGRDVQKGASAPTADHGQQFLRGGGAMGALIRAHDWEATPLGAPQHWPQSLRTAVRLMLSTNHPIFIFWGPELVCLYNDAYSASLGPEKHPAMLGQPGRTAWDEIWPMVGPQIDFVMSGAGATWREDDLVPITRYGSREDVYWTYSYGPIDDDGAAGGIGGVLVICSETTARVVAALNQQFLVRLADALREIGEPDAVLAVASQMLGERLGADCAGYAEVDDAGETAHVDREWQGAAPLSVIGAHRLADYGEAVISTLQAGEIVAVDDVDHSPLTAGARGAAYRRLGISAFMLAPKLREGKLRGIMFLLARRPRRWLESEASLVAEAVARIGSALVSARATAALAEREWLLRAIGESTSELIFAKDRDHRLLYANNATLRVIGKRAAEVIGHTDREWHDDAREAQAIIDNDDHVLRTGESLRVAEIFTGPDGAERVFEGTKAPMRDESSEIVGVVGVSRDMTERNRQQRHLRLMVDELNHRVKNTLAIVQSIAHQTFRGTAASAPALSTFEDRLAALAKAHGLLTRENWESVDLAELIGEAVYGHVGQGERVKIEGPAVRLAPKTAVTIAMALHELSTNAAKYGALSVDGGQIAINWSFTPGDGALPVLRLSWQEAGGPPVVAPRRRGFGSRMIERALAAELQGKVVLDFRPEGVVCTIEAALEPLPV